MISVKASALAAAMKHAASVVETRNTIPILANVQLFVRNGQLELAATDLDVEVRQSIALSSADGELATTVDARRLAALAGAVDKNADITLSLDDGRLVVKCGRSRWNLPVLPATDFPAIPCADLPASVELAGSDLSRGLSRVQWSISTEVTRAWLNGAFLHAEAGKVALASTNGHGLTQLTLDCTAPDAAPETILSTKFVRLLTGLCADAKSVTLEWSADRARATIGDVTLVAKAIQGTFPDYRRVIPSKGDDPVTFEPESLRGALRRVQLVANEKTRSVKIEREADKLTLSVTSPEGGTAREEMPASGAGVPWPTGFNARYLEQMAEAIGGDTITMHQAEAGAQARFERTVPDGAVCVVMPMWV